jgi:hypothetical protein
MRGSSRTSGWDKKALLFLKKKKQKDFFNSGAGVFEHLRPRVTKVFCAAFFQKSGCLLIRSREYGLADYA